MLRTLSILVVSCSVAAAADLTPEPLTLLRPGHQSDFPALAVDSSSTPWIAWVEWDGTQDSLILARRSNDALTHMLTLGQPGIIHQPALAVAKGDVLVVVWSQVNDADLMQLNAQTVRNGRATGEVITLAASSNGGNVLARSATDRSGRVWVVWQSMRGSLSDIFCRTYDPTTDQWSSEIQVTDNPSGDWEPCVAFDASDGAWVIYDSSLGNEFNIYANRVSLDSTVGERKLLIETDRYEARVSAVGTPDGRGIWLTCERGNQQWGLDMRAHAHGQGLNGRRNSVLAYWDLQSGEVEEMPTIDPLLADLPGPPPRPIDEKREEPAPVAAINLPQVFLDSAGRPWMTVRYFKQYCWRIALARFDTDSKQWTEPFALPDCAVRSGSSHVQCAGGRWPSVDMLARRLTHIQTASYRRISARHGRHGTGASACQASGSTTPTAVRRLH